MTTIWKPTKKAESNNTDTMLSSWSRQQKIAMIACCALLALALAVSACSKQSPKPALAGTSSPRPAPAVQAASTLPAGTEIQSAGLNPQSASQTVAAKKVRKQRPANVTYSDPNTGVSFMYPRKFVLAGADKAAQSASLDAPMNFVQPGGTTIATVAVSNTLYPRTDFASGFFRVNVNRTLSAEACQHFAFVDASDPDGEPIDAQKVKVGTADMEMTSEFEGNATKQTETQYYHNYENGACYEYVLGLNTAGYGTRQDIQPVNRDEVFARLEKILATVKTRAVEQPTAEQTVAADSSSDQTGKLNVHE